MQMPATRTHDSTLASLIAQLAAVGIDRYPSAAPRLLKAATIAATKAIHPQGATGHTYWVQSGTIDDQFYLVDLAHGSCTCKDYENRNRDCCHQLAVRLLNAAGHMDEEYRRARDFGSPIPFTLTPKGRQVGVA